MEKLKGELIVTSGNPRPIIKQIDEVERHISQCEQKIDQLQEQHDIPVEWFTEQFNADTHDFETDAVKDAYQQISRYHANINVYLKKIGLTREALKSISDQINTDEADDVEAKIRMAIVEENLRLVVNIAKKYRHQAPGMEFLELIQAGNSGLVKAIDNFDYERGFQFKTYATWWIRQSVSRAVAGQNSNSES